MLRSLSLTLAVVIVLTFPVHAIVDDNHRGHWYRVHGGYHEKWREHGRWGEHGRWAQHGPGVSMVRAVTMAALVKMTMKMRTIKILAVVLAVEDLRWADPTTVGSA